ncbi:adenosine receptor A2b-like [Oculina patagonica]
MEIFFSILGWLLTIVTTAGNGFVFFVIATNRRLHSSANCFVLSLALADFGVGIAVFPSSYFCNYSMACNSRVYMAFFWFFLHSSVTNLCVLTWDRYNCIVHPLRYNTSMTDRRPGVVILIAWLIAFAISLSLLVGMYATTSNTALKVLRLTGVSAFDIISCVLLFYAVVRILVVARAQLHQETAMELQVQCNRSSNLSIGNETSNSRRYTFKHNTFRFIIAIVVLFLGCYAVVNSVVLCMAFSCQVSDNAGQIVTCLLVLNSAVNPLVYAFLKSDIKMEISKLFSRENAERETRR